MTGCQARQ